VWLGCPWG